MTRQTVALKRDCAAVQIPSGEPITLSAGTEVTITQALGGSYTVSTPDVYLARIAMENADALGFESPAVSKTAGSVAKSFQPQDNPDQSPHSPQAQPISLAEVERQVWEELRSCYDPEIPVNIVELGLVYKCQITAMDQTPLPATESSRFRVSIDMTLTAPGCGMGPVIAGEVESKVLRVPGVSAASVQIVFDPIWDQAMMSEAARLQLGL
jgi:metal-sulfur cluster biosynthetic enzyme